MNPKSSLWTLFVFFLLALVCGILMGIKLFTKSQNNFPFVILNGQKIIIEVADTPQKITRGLSGRTLMASDRGMLFVFNSPVNSSFWMKEMKFNLDFIFIKDYAVVNLIENVPFPKDNESPQTVTPKSEYNMVLEVNSGVIEETKVKIGDRITLTGEKFSR